WRMHRDFLYDARMRGVEWNAVRAKYTPLVERVSERAELNDILGMMVAEVGALHSQVAPGDIRRPAPEGAPAGLGAVLARTAKGANDIATFAREFYANVNRDGLIIDVRRNQGGNIDSWIIEKLLRKAWAYWAPPSGRTYANMQNTFRGHLVVLVDELTYSDGE